MYLSVTEADIYLLKTAIDLFEALINDEAADFFNTVSDDQFTDDQVATMAAKAKHHITDMRHRLGDARVALAELERDNAQCN